MLAKTAQTVQTMVDEDGKRAVYYDASMQQQHEPLGVTLVNSNMRNMCGVVIDTNDNNNNNYYETPTKKKTGTKRSNNQVYKEESSMFDMNDLTPNKIERRTAFSDVSSMLLCVIIVCGGSIDDITTTCSKLTWIEEWVLYYKYVYGYSKN